MNSAVKQYPRPSSRLIGQWTLLASVLLAALPTLGQGFGVSQTGRITINDAQFVAGNTIPAKASPYPSSIVISNQFVGTIQKAAVVLPGLTHAYAHDIDMILVSPAGKRINLMSDVALNAIFSGADITIDAGAAAGFPASQSPGSAVAGGSYRPTDFAPADTYPDLPGGLTPAVLGDLVGDSPAGDWRLFIMDDKFEHSGSINGWQLKLWTTPVFGAMTNAVNTLENIPVTFTASFDDTDTPADLVQVKAVALDKTLVSDTNITVSATGKTRNITVVPNLNQNGTTTLQVTVSDGITTVTNTTTLTVGAVNQPPTISLNTNRVAYSAGLFSLVPIATVGDVDGALDDISVFATSGNTNLVPNNFVVDVTRVGAARNLVVAPRGTTTGTVDLQIFARDSGTSNNVSSAANLQVTVSPVPQALFSSISNLVIPDDASVVSQSIVVSNVFGDIGRVFVSLNGIDHPSPSDLRVRLKNPGSTREALLLNNAGDSTAAAGLWLALDDFGSGPLPSTLVPGVFQPSQALSTFNDTSANGTWTLEVQDTSAGPSGAAAVRGGATLRFWTKPQVRGLINTNIAENTTRQFNFTVADYDGQVTNVVASSSNPSLATVSVALNGTNGVLTVVGQPDQNGVVNVTVTARDNNNYTGSQVIAVTVNPFNTPPNISPIGKQLTYAGLPLGPVDFTVDDLGISRTATDETPANNIVVTARSSNQSLVPDGNIILGGTGIDRTFTIYPVGTAEGEVTITLTATDAGFPTPAKSTSFDFLFQVLPPASPLYYLRNPIVIADSGTGNGATNAEPYPSTINVADKIGLIRQVQVTLVGVQHPSPQDLGVLLVGPNGEQVVLMSGAGGSSAIQNRQLVFSDSAAGALPASGPLASGTYRPSNLNGRTAADFPGTGTSRPLSSNLSIFNGIVPNGNWSLFVRDFTGNTKGDGQQIAGGWMINFVTEANLAAIPTQETPEDTVKRVGLVIGDDQPGIPVTLTATSDRPDIVPNSASALKFEPSVVATANHTLVITPAADKFGDVNITVTAQVGTGTPSSRTFLLRVLPVNDDPTIAGDGSNDRSKPAGLIDGPRTITVADKESNVNDIVLTATSSNTALIPNENIILHDRNDGSGIWDITILPNGIGTGETTITLSAQVGSEKPGVKSFKYNVTRNRSFMSDGGRIEIVQNGTASPYPSINRVSGMSGVISKVSVTILGLSHTFPDDIDMLLVSPDGSKSVVLLADAGGGAPTNSISNITLTIDDEGAALTSEEKLTHRTYQPGNFGADVFPAPAPSSGYTSTLSTFNGSTPNGDWKLYVLDDTFSDGGAIERGWILIIETAPTISPIAAQQTREDTAFAVNFDIADADTEPVGLRTWALSSNQTLVNNTNLVTGPTNALSRVLNITPSANQNGTNTITVYVADNRTTNSTSFHLTVTPVDDAPLVSTSTNLVQIAEDGQTNIVFRVRDIDSVLSVTNATITSSNPSLVPNNVTNLSLAGPNSLTIGDNGDITATVKPLANQFGETQLTFTITDGTTPVSSVVRFLVNAVNDAPTISVTNNTYSVIAGQSIVGIPVTVGDIETPARNLILSASSLNQALIPNSNIELGGVNENRLLSVRPIGVEAGSATIVLTVKDEANAETTINVTINVTRAPGITWDNGKTAITIRDNNTATPYGSTITVPPVQGFVHSVTVTLEGLNHNSPDDLDILLVGPGGSPKKVLLLSDAGGNIPLSNGRIVFEDGAAGLVPDNGPLVTGSYRPTNYGDGDVFASPAPAGPYASALSEFIGSDPEGVWTLYVVDDTGNDAGSIAGGWSLKIVTTPRITTTTASPLIWDEDNTATVNLEVNDLDSGSKLDQLELFASSTNPTLLPSTNVTFIRISGDPNLDGGPWIYQAVLNPQPNAWGTNLLTLGVRRKSDRAADTVVLANQVRLDNDAPQISRITEKTADENTPLRIDFLVTDVDTDPKDLSIRATSGNNVLISDTRLLFFGQTNFVNALSSSEVSLTLWPNTNQTGSTEITLLVTDNSTNPPARTATSTFRLNVTPFNDPPVIRAITDVAIPAGATSTNIAFGVDDVDSSTVKVTATSSNTNLVQNSNIRIFRDQAGTLPAEDFFAPGNRWIQVKSEVGRRGAAVITVVATDGSKTSERTFTVNVVESRERGYANAAPIVIRDNSTSNPYPSTIQVTDLIGDVSQVKVRINGFAHSFPSDVDMLLVAPNGKSVMLMSDAGGGTPVTNVTFTLADGASEDVPSAGGLTSREYRPRNYDPAADPMPAPAPAAPFGTTLGSLAGSPANGVWSLYIVDDTTSDAGFVNGGWELFILTQPRITGLANITVKEDEPFSVPFTIVEEGFADATFTLWSQSTNSTVIRTNDITFRGSGTNWTLTGTPVPNASGVSEITVLARNPYAQTISGKFTVTVSSQNDRPTISDVADITIPAGTASAPVSFTYSDVETPQKDLILTVTSSNPNLIPTNNVFVLGGFLSVAPVGNRIGTAEITLSVSDGDPVVGPATTSFRVTVTPALNAQFANPEPITLANSPGVGKGNPYPSTIVVDRVRGTVQRVTVTLAQLNHAYPSDLDILLVGPQGQQVVLMSDAGGGERLTNVRLTLDDAASEGLPFNPATAIVSGSYKPTNHQGSDAFPDAPAGTISATLSAAFQGTNPNGTWSLYVIDDAAPDGFTLTGGWILNIFTTEPTISAISDVTTDENVAITVPFTVADADTPVTNLTVSATSNNPGLVALAAGGSGASRTVTITPTPFASGSAVVTVAVSDGTTTSETSFTVTVNPVNQAPEITGLSDRPLPSNVTLQQNFTVFDQETAASNLVVTVSISRPEFGTVDITGTDATRTLVFRSSGDQGEVFITVTVDDGELTTSKTIGIIVGPPYVLEVSNIADQNMVENESPRAVAFTVTGSTSGNTTVTGAADNTALVNRVSITGTGDNRNVVITLNPGQFGESLITVTATDDLGGEGTSTFKLTVTRANRAPVLGPIAPQATRPNVPAIVNLTVTDEDTPPAQWVFTSDNSNPSLVRNVIFSVNSTGAYVATVNLVRDASGTATVTIHVSDGTTRVSQAFPLTVTENAPTLGVIADQITTANTPVEITLDVQDIDTPLAELTFSATSSNPSVIAGVTFDKSGAVAKATVNPVKDATGVATVTITVRDSINSASRTFAVAVNAAGTPEFARPTLTTNPDGSKTITITWQNGGELEWALSAAGPWTGTGNTSGTYSEPANAASRLFRIKR